tara:strand:+ start:20608 stop:20994 length:387 start_codon:yes stop_codon:yes gene_type:complete
MIPINNIDNTKLIKYVYDIIAKTTIELGHRTDGKTMALLANTFAADLKIENRFKRLYITDIVAAFRNGIRSTDEQQYLNIPTFYRWVRAQKLLIDIDTHKVEQLKEPKENAPLYREKIKLIKTIKKQN